MLDVRYPEFQNELIRMAEADQQEIRSRYHAISTIKSESKRKAEYAGIAKRCHERAERMVEILRSIENPTAENIGYDGAEALLLITQHSYVAIMKDVLAIFELLYKQDPKSIPVSYMPALIDRIQILEKQKQLYGTQWMVDNEERPFLIEVDDFVTANTRRKAYGLGPVQLPQNLADGAQRHPLGKGAAYASHQKKLTDEEYAEYSEFQVRSLTGNTLE